jgi:hypothetical protein
MIYIGDNPEDDVRLHSFGAKTTSKGSVLTVQIAITDPLKLGYFLKDLQKLQEAQRQPKRRPLALPAPERT